MTSLSTFRTAYPHCTLVSELVGVEHGQYLVRCCIAQSGQLIASGLSAAPNLEAAEDQARDRALALLAQIGVPPLSAASPPINPPPPQNGAVSPAPTPPAVATVAPAAETSPPPAKSAPTPSPSAESASPPAPPAPPAPALVAPEPGPPSAPSPDLPPEPPPTDAIAAPPAKPASSSPKVMPNGTIDFTDIIARTNLEMKRLGWTNEQGRSYLLQTYGKRSRQRLDDNELLEFLAYLEAQPDP